jgi:ABC-type glutathione transport system ATPase component
VSAALVEVEGLAKTFDVSAPWLNRVAERKPRQYVHAVDDVGFTIARGKTLALVGESGCGKSTVARLLVGLYTPTRGRVVFDGVDAGAAGSARPASIRRRMQMIFQDPYASLNPRWKVSDIVAEPLREHGFGADASSRAKETRQRIDDRVGELLESVGCRRRQVPAPVLGRPATADLDRARARDPARVPGLRRADLGARCLGAGAGPQHHEGTAGAAWPHLPVHLAQPRRRSSRQ